jgi:hypothetical protein
MPHPLQITIDRLPELLEKNAPAMMRRMVGRMKADVAKGDLSGRVSHGGLFLKVGEEDLVREFVAAIKEVFAAEESSGFGSDNSLSLQTESGYGGGIDEFESSTDAFRTLCRDAAKLGVTGADRYHNRAFLTALKDAFTRSRMDVRATDELMPYAKAALNAELAVLYTKLDEIGTRGQAA